MTDLETEVRGLLNDYYGRPSRAEVTLNLATENEQTDVFPMQRSVEENMTLSGRGQRQRCGMGRGSK